jgi:WD40 repeat protein
LACRRTRQIDLFKVSKLAGEQEPRVFKWAEQCRTEPVFSPDEKLIAIGSLHHVCVWEVATGKQLYTWKITDSTINGLAFSPDSKSLAVGFWEPSQPFDGIARPNWDTFQQWDVSTGQVRFSMRPPPGPFVRPNHMMYPPNGNLLAIATRRFVVFYDGPIPKFYAWRWTPTQVTACCISPDDKKFATGQADGSVHVWDVPSKKEDWETALPEDVRRELDLPPKK